MYEDIFFKIFTLTGNTSTLQWNSDHVPYTVYHGVCHNGRRPERRKTTSRFRYHKNIWLRSSLDPRTARKLFCDVVVGLNELSTGCDFSRLIYDYCNGIVMGSNVERNSERIFPRKTGDNLQNYSLELQTFRPTSMSRYTRMSKYKYYCFKTLIPK